MTDPVPLMGPDPTPEPRLTIAVPSAGRPGRVLVGRMLPPDQFVVVVPENEVALYEAAQPELEVVPHPPEVGRLPRKRQWILDRYAADRGHAVLMVDDDIEEMIHMEHGPGDRKCVIQPDESMAIIHRLAWETAQAGIHLFGFETSGSILNYNDLAPFKLTGYVVGSAMGVVGGGRLSFNPETLAGDDYWLSLLNAYEHRWCLIDNRYCPNLRASSKSKTFAQTGGMGSHRTAESEENDYQVLRRYFGGDVVQRKKATGRAKLSHPAQRTMVVPF